MRSSPVSLFADILYPYCPQPQAASRWRPRQKERGPQLPTGLCLQSIASWSCLSVDGWRHRTGCGLRSSTGTASHNVHGQGHPWLEGLSVVWRKLAVLLVPHVYTHSARCCQCHCRPTKTRKHQHGPARTRSGGAPLPVRLCFNVCFNVCCSVCFSMFFSVCFSVCFGVCFGVCFSVCFSVRGTSVFAM